MHIGDTSFCEKARCTFMLLQVRFRFVYRADKTRQDATGQDIDSSGEGKSLKFYSLWRDKYEGDWHYNGYPFDEGDGRSILGSALILRGANNSSGLSDGLIRLLGNGRTL